MPDVREETRDASSLATQILIMGEVTYLLSHSPAHLGYSIVDVMRFFMTPVRMNQFRLYRTEDRPVGIAVWAYLSAEVAARYRTGSYELQKGDWRSGPDLWFIEFVAPFGHGRRILDDLRRNSFSDAHARFFRRRRGGVRLADIYGCEHPRALGRQPAANPNGSPSGQRPDRETGPSSVDKKG